MLHLQPPVRTLVALTAVAVDMSADSFLTALSQD
jgi:hypothetical protein